MMQHLYKSLQQVNGTIVCLGFFHRINSISVIQMQQVTFPCFLDYFLKPVLNQSIILTLAGQSNCYSHIPECQGRMQLIPVLKTFIRGSQGSNSRLPAHEADTLTTRPPPRCEWYKFFFLL